jgi:hypothetical protein
MLSPTFEFHNIHSMEAGEGWGALLVLKFGGEKPRVFT